MENIIRNELFNMADLETSIVNANFSNFYELFLEEIKISTDSSETYKRCIRAFFNYLQENNISKPTRQDIKNYVLYLKDSNKSNATIQLYLVSVRKLFIFLEENGLYYNIANGIKIENKKNELPSKLPLTETQSKNLILSATSLRDRIILELMLFCGLRDIEIVRANRTDFEMIDNQAILYIQGKGRTTKSEFVKIPDVLFYDVKEYFKQRKDSNVSAFVSTSNNNRDERMTTRSISGIVKGYLIKNGFDSARYTAHALRHTAITLGMKNGLSLNDVSEMARHKSQETTKIYNHYNTRINNNSEIVIAAAILNA